MARRLSEEKKEEQRKEGKIRIENPSKLRKGSSKKMQKARTFLLAYCALLIKKNQN